VETDLWDGRDIDVVHVQAIHTQKPAAKVHITVKDRQGPMDGRDQGVIHGDIHVIIKERCLDSRAKATDARTKDVGLDGAIHGSHDGVAIALELGIVALKGTLAHLAIAILQPGDERCVGQLFLSARTIGRRRKASGQIHVLEHTVHPRERGQRFAGHRQQALLGRGQGVRLGPQQIFQPDPVRGERP